MEEQRPTEQHYDEIDPRDIFRTLWKWKNTIVAVTLIFMLLNGLASFFLITPVYEAKALVLPTNMRTLGSSANPIYVVTDKNPDEIRNRQTLLDNMDSIIRLTQIDYHRFKEIMTGDYVLEQTINKLDLKEKEFKLEKLKELINVQPKKDGQATTDIIEVTVVNANPELAAQIANTLVEETGLYIDEFNKKNMDKLGKTMEAQLAAAQEDLSRAIGELKQYQEQNPAQSASLKGQVENQRLAGEVKRRQDIVDSFSSKILELKLQQTMSEAEEPMLVLSAATTPEGPVKPNKKLNVAIAGVLGLMFSVFGVFLAEYLRKNPSDDINDEVA